MEFILDFILHIDQYMINIVQDYHTWAYAILFIIIFCETGLVVTPFLPGDSLPVWHRYLLVADTYEARGSGSDAVVRSYT